MASDSNKFTARFLIFVLVSSQLPLTYSSVSLLNEYAVKGLFRNRRQMCQDGTYIHQGRTCCLCAAGLRLESHCSTRPDDGRCEPCEERTYRSFPTAQLFCEPCTSCEHPNANLEEVEPCTSYSNSKCQCKKGHYCSTEQCRICHPCHECGPEGIKVACTTTNNTICNDPITKGSNVGIIAGILVPVVCLILVGLVVYLWRRGQLCSRVESPSIHPSSDKTKGTATEMELLSIKDLHPHLPDIASILGWKDTKGIALRSEISKTTIEACQLDHSGDTEEQTLQLLGIFVEKHGRAASSTLIEMLRKSGKTNKAEKVIELLHRDNNIAASSNV